MLTFDAGLRRRQRAPQSVWRRVLLALASLAAMTCGRLDAVAADGARIALAAEIAVEAGRETALMIGLPSPASLPPHSFVRIRGMPARAQLVGGYPIAAGAWAVPLGSIASLALTAEPGSEGRSSITVALVTLDGATLAEAPAVLIIMPRPPPPQLPPAIAQRAAQLLARGDDALRNGDVSAARGFYRTAADLGLATALLQLGTSFDPIELKTLGAVSVLANVAEARAWYVKAREAGVLDAEARIRRLKSYP
jgi:hypothetical protein